MLTKLSMTARTAGFVCLVCLALVAVDAWHSWNTRSEHLHDVEQSAGNVARALAQHADDSFKGADSSLNDLIERLDADGMGPQQLLRLRQVMVRQMAQLDQLSALFIFDASGRCLVDSTEEAPVSRTDWPSFQFHRSHPSRGPHIGAPLRGKDGAWFIPLSRRIEHADASFAGVALAAIDLDYFKRFYQTFDIGQRGAVGLVSDDGVLLMRRPYSDAHIGQNVRGTPLFTTYDRTGRAGTDFFKSPQDGEVRLNSYRPLRQYPLFVSAALSKSEILENWQRSTLVHLGGVLTLCLLAALSGIHLIGQIGRRAQAEHALLAARDALEAANRTLEKQAMQDGLTGLANRRRLDVTLANEFSRATRSGALLAFVMLDVDLFKQYNDRYGHSAGDDCLRQLSGTILGLTPQRPGDLAARYGGEEIALVLPGADAAGALAVAERIRLAVLALALPHAGSRFGVVTVSAGVAALVPQRGALPEQLVEAADRALYQAKEGGRNRVAGGAPSLAGAAGLPMPDEQA